MAKLIQSDLSIATKYFSFDVKTRSGVTIITGDSATGKTLFIKTHKLMEASAKTRKYKFISGADSEPFLDIIGQLHNKIIFVDNADIVVPRTIEAIRAIHYSDCQFIFMGRDVGRYDRDYDNVAEFISTVKGKYILRYIMSDGDSLFKR